MSIITATEPIKAVKQNILQSLKQSSITQELADGLEKGDPFVTEITPEIADTLLAISNTFNRVPSPAKVKTYMQAMVAGEWQYNGDPIRFYQGDYKLADGQHRLQAIARAKKPQQTLIVPNIKHEAYLTIDTGKNRTARDAFLMMNHENAGEKSTCCYIALKWLTGKQLRNVPSPSTTAILAFEKSHSMAVSEAVRFAVALQTEYGRYLTPGNIAACLTIDYLHREQLDPKFMEFLEALASKSYSDKDSPVYHLIRLIDRHLEAKTIKNGKLNTERMIGSILRGWKREREGMIVTSFNDLVYPARKNEPFSAVL